MPCFYVPNLAQKSTEIIISGDEHHHIRNVFRKHIGDEILLTNGKGLLAKAEITEISKKETRPESRSSNNWIKNFKTK